MEELSNSVEETEGPDLLAEDAPSAGSPEPTQKQLTPEELEQIARDNKVKQDFIDSLGVFILVQFENETSVNIRFMTSDKAPSDAAVIAALNKLRIDFEEIIRTHIQQELMGKMILQEQMRKAQQQSQPKSRIVVPR